MTANMLFQISSIIHSKCHGVYSQQISNTSLHSEDQGPGQIDREPPRLCLHSSSRGPQHPHPLIHAPHRQCRLLIPTRIALRKLLFPIFWRLACQNDIPPFRSSVVPFHLQHVSIGMHHSRNECQYDEEYARPCVAACGRGCPLGGVEGLGVIVGENHGHGH